MITFDIIAQILWTSLATSSYFVLFALAFAFVLKVNKVFNFAQAAMMIAAYYGAHTAVQVLGLPGWAALVGALLCSAVMAVLVERFGFRMLRIRKAEQLFVFIFTLIVSEFTAFLAMLIFGIFPTTIFQSLFSPVTLVGNIAISAWDIPALASTIVVVTMLFVYLRFSRTGQFMIAVADNPDLAELYGIRRERIFLIVMLIASVLVGVGMFLYGTRAQVQPNTSIDLMLFAIAATIMGGIGSLGGAVAMAVVLGVIQNASVLFISSEWQSFLLYAFLFIAIVFLPNGVRLPDHRRLFRRPAPAFLPSSNGPEV